MITYRLNIVIGGREQRITIYADHCVITTAEEARFYHGDDTLIATVPTSIIVEMIES